MMLVRGGFAALVVAGALAGAAACGDSQVPPIDAPPHRAPDAGPALVCGEPARGPVWDRFVDVTAASGIDFVYDTTDFRSGALAAADLDGDGLPEIIAGNRGGGVAVYRNLGHMQFAREAIAAIDPAAPLTAIAAADLDNDGDPDLVLARPGSWDVYANDGRGDFARISHVEVASSPEQVLPVDLDGDGRLDLAFANRAYPVGAATQNRLYLNRGDLAFADAGALGPDGLSWAIGALDLDGDGDQDLYVANDALVATFAPGARPASNLPPDSLLRNDGVDARGIPQFTDLAPAQGMTAPRSSMSAVVGDFDRDGSLDVFVTNIGAKSLFAHAPAGFVDRADALGADPYLRTDDVNVPVACAPGTTHEDCLIVSWSAALTDFDLDGYDELLVVNGTRGGLLPPPPTLLVRGADPVFHEVSVDLSCPDARGLVVTDLDGDGDPDLAIAQSVGRLLVIANRGRPAAKAWLDVRLAGRASNRDGIGAVVTATLASGRTVVRPVGAGGTLNSAAPAEAFFGLGDDAVATLAVAWPSGRTSRLVGPLTGVVTVEE